MLLYLIVFHFLFLLVSVSGTVTYSEVRIYLKKQSDIIMKYKSIGFGNKTLLLTGNHLVYARGGNGKFNPV